MNIAYDVISSSNIKLSLLYPVYIQNRYIYFSHHISELYIYEDFNLISQAVIGIENWNEILLPLK